VDSNLHLVHSKGSTSGTQQHQCEVGDLNFSNYSNYKRHRREKHYDFKANLDFVEDMDAFKLVECIKCTKTFKRMSDLKRHDESVHGSTGKTVQCDLCEKVYTRKDALKRHVKSVQFTNKICNTSGVITFSICLNKTLFKNFLRQLKQNLSFYLISVFKVLAHRA
jgi:uncharacterized Zn-finger protein